MALIVKITIMFVEIVVTEREHEGGFWDVSKSTFDVGAVTPTGSFGENSLSYLFVVNVLSVHMLHFLKQF